MDPSSASRCRADAGARVDHGRDVREHARSAHSRLRCGDRARSGTFELPVGPPPPAVPRWKGPASRRSGRPTDRPRVLALSVALPGGDAPAAAREAPRACRGQDCRCGSRAPPGAPTGG